MYTCAAQSWWAMALGRVIEYKILRMFHVKHEVRKVRFSFSIYFSTLYDNLNFFGKVSVDSYIFKRLIDRCPWISLTCHPDIGEKSKNIVIFSMNNSEVIIRDADYKEISTAYLWE